jgi:hypothetical protein
MTNLATPSADARAGPRPSGGTPSIATLMGAGRGRISVFLVSNLMELGQGGFSTFHLLLSYTAKARSRPSPPGRRPRSIDHTAPPERVRRSVIRGPGPFDAQQ